MSGLEEVSKQWPVEGLERVTSCPTCGHTERALLHEGLRDRLFFCAPGEWSLFSCRQCGSAYLDPRPTPETIGLAYKRYFTHADNGMKSEQLNALAYVRRALGNGYRNTRFGIDRQPCVRMGAQLAPLLRRQRAMMDAEGRHLDLPAPGQSLLDVGCGDGRFVGFAAEMGWRAEGVEPDPQAVQVARGRGLVIHQGSVDCLTDRKGAYDVITLSHVIEHVHDPRGLLRRCFDLLKPGGLIWLETPNIESAGHVRYGRDWRDLDPPRHLVLFTWTALNSLLRDVGFTSAAPLPGRPMAVDTFPASEAIKAGRDPQCHGGSPLSVRWQAWRADRRSDLKNREFITVCARRPSASEAVAF